MGRANSRAETALVRSFLSSFAYARREFWDREGGGLSSLPSCATELGVLLKCAVPDFPMSDVERKSIFVAKCFELLGLKVE